jgi:hypothetical protein
VQTAGTFKCLEVDDRPLKADNTEVIDTVEHTVQQFQTAMQKLRRATRDPAKAAAFLVRAGIAERTKKTKAHPQGVRLAKRFR